MVTCRGGFLLFDCFLLCSSRENGTVVSHKDSLVQLEREQAGSSTFRSIISQWFLLRQFFWFFDEIISLGKLLCGLAPLYCIDLFVSLMRKCLTNVFRRAHWIHWRRSSPPSTVSESLSALNGNGRKRNGNKNCWKQWRPPARFLQLCRERNSVFQTHNFQQIAKVLQGQEWRVLRPVLPLPIHLHQQRPRPLVHMSVNRLPPVLLRKGVVQPVRMKLAISPPPPPLTVRSKRGPEGALWPCPKVLNYGRSPSSTSHNICRVFKINALLIHDPKNETTIRERIRTYIVITWINCESRNNWVLYCFTACIRILYVIIKLLVY